MSAPLRIGKFTNPGDDVNKTFAPSGTVSEPSGFQAYMDRLVKLIPGEVVGLYLVGIGIIPLNSNIIVFGIWAVVCLGLVILVRAHFTGDPANKIPPQWKAVFISAVSYVIWVFTMQGPLQSFGLGVPFIGSLIVLVWTFIIPFIYHGS